MSTTDTAEPRTVALAIEIADQPSRSKGWSRYRARAAGTPVVRSSTGNEWLSSRQTAELAEGVELEVELDVNLNVGKDTRRRQERSQRTFRIRVTRGASCELTHKPGSQGMTLAISGAEVL